MNPWSRILELQGQMLETASELASKGSVLDERLPDLFEVRVGDTEHDVVLETPTFDLLRYHPGRERRYDEPLLFVYALINRSYILDLQPERSVVRRFLEEGFDVYLIDWKEPSLLEADCSLDHYINVWIDDCVEAVLERADCESLHLFGYCMGGTMSLIYSALHPKRVRTLGLLATGVEFGTEKGQLEEWAEDYDPWIIAEAFGNVPADFLAAGFALMNPVNNLLTKYIQLYEHLEDEEFVENFGRVERWIREGIDVSGRTYAEFIDWFYHQNLLYRNELTLNGRSVDLGNITMPVLQIVGIYDHLVPPSTSKPLQNVIPARDTAIKEFPSGHVGLAVSEKAHDRLWPEVCEWFTERSTPRNGPG